MINVYKNIFEYTDLQIDRCVGEKNAVTLHFQLSGNLVDNMTLSKSETLSEIKLQQLKVSRQCGIRQELEKMHFLLKMQREC